MLTISDLDLELSRENSVEERWRFKRKHGVLLISAFEMVGSIIVMIVYIYALVARPDWYPVLLPFSNDPTNEEAILPGMMYIIILTSFMEFLLGLCLLDGVTRENVERVHFWLSSMLTYLILVTIVVFGVGLGGIHFPKLDLAASINVFVRFMAICAVNTWVEKKKMKRNFQIELDAREQSQESSNRAQDDDRKYPPPSYECTFASCSYSHMPPRRLSVITEEQQ